MTTIDDMLAELGDRPSNVSLGRKFYVDPAFYHLDLDTTHYRHWLFAGHACEVLKAGSYLTLQVGDYPILVVRSDDGAIRAFHNSCRHRGSRICAAEKGAVAKLVCPYHQWTYGLDGNLLYARDMGDRIDKTRLGLKPIACETIGGYVFVCLAHDTPDFATFRMQIEPYLAPHRLDETKIAFESTIVEKANWKLVWQNNRECYHCAANHPELCRTLPETPTVTGIAGAMHDPTFVAHWTRCEAAGLPSRFRMADTGQYRTTRMPLLSDAVSYTMSGKAAVRLPLSAGIAEQRIGALLLFHYPSLWTHVLGDHAVSFRALPLGPRETQLTTKWLVHKDAREGVDYDLDELTRVWLSTNDQDRRIVEENQIGVESPVFQPGPYAPQAEGGVSQFVNWYRNAVRNTLLVARKNLDHVA